MNYLAHFWLAGSRITDRVGGLLGDFVKGPLPCGLPADLASGVALHRQIDLFADSHPVFRASRRRFSANRRRFAGIIVDLFYDHVLARDWEHYHGGTLAQSTAGYYADVACYRHILPERLGRILPRMCSDDWLGGYAQLQTVGWALDNLGRHRLKSGVALVGAIDELEVHYAALSQDAAEFLPAAHQFSQRWLRLRDTHLISAETEL